MKKILLITIAIILIGLLFISGCITKKMDANVNNEEGKTMDDGKLKMEYLGHGSLKLFLPTGEVCYIDPYAGNDYKEPADLILVTHQHSDHNQLSLVNQKPTCVVFQNFDAIQEDGYNEVEFYGMKIEPVQAYNKNHPIDSCVGYVLRVGGKVIYVAGDTSKTEQMKDLGTYNIDYAFLPMDGVYNMDIPEAIECEKLIKAKHTIPYHLAPGDLFDEERAKEFDAPSALIMKPNEIIELK